MDDVVARDVQGAAGVGSVERQGGAEREIRVELDPDRLLALGLTAAEVNAQLARANTDQGGGGGDLAGQEYAIRALGSASSVGQLAATPIRLATGDTVRLNQLGAVSAGANEPEGFALLDGQPVVAFGVYRATGAATSRPPRTPRPALRRSASATPTPGSRLWTTPPFTPKPITRRRWTRSTRARSWRSRWCSCFCAVGGPRW